MAVRSGDPVQSVPLIFVYLGPELPRYARSSLTLARKNFDGEIIVLRDFDDSESGVEGVAYLNISAWYDRVPFQSFSTMSPLDGLFRGGFWLKAVERFFVLDQYCQVTELKRFFHAELDVLILNLENLANEFDRIGTGLFIPAQRQSRALASLVYSNSPDSLKELLKFFIDHCHLGNEMKMLGAFLQKRPEMAIGLPSETATDPSRWPVSKRSVDAEVGLFDAQGFGTWLLGYDPRNIKGTSWNKFLEGDAEPLFKTLRFWATWRGNKMYVSNRAGIRFEIRTLHVHSKQFRRLLAPGVLWFYTWALTLPSKVPVVIRLDGLVNSIIQKTLSPRGERWVLGLPRGIRAVVGQCVEPLISAGSLVLSERQRAVAAHFLKAPFPPRPHESLDIVRPSDSRELGVSDEWMPMLQTYRPHDSREVWRQVAVFLEAFKSDRPRLVVLRGEIPTHSRLVRRKKQVLFVSTRKSYLDSKHALTFWSSLPMKNTWSFDTRFQVIDPRFVWEMFPNGEVDVLQWAELGLEKGTTNLSAFQSYGTWLFSNRRSSVRLCTVANSL